MNDNLEATSTDGKKGTQKVEYLKEEKGESGRVRQQLTKLRRVLRETRRLKPQSQAAIEALDIEILKSSGEQKKQIRCKHATAIYRHGQLLALETRLINQIYKLKAQKEKIEQGSRRIVLNE